MKKLLINSLTALTIMTIATPAEAQRKNPLLEPSTAVHGTPQFNLIQPQDYEEAINAAIAEHNREIEAIVKQRSIPDFENTIAAFDRSGRTLNNALYILGNLEAATGDTLLMKVNAKMTPVISAHFTDITLNEPLWERIKQVYDNRDKFTDMDAEDNRLLDETYLNFVQSGANLCPEDREKLRNLNSELSLLTMKFGQNTSNELKNPAFRMFLTLDQIEGLPEANIQAAQEEAKRFRAEEGKEYDNTYAFTTYAPSYSPFMKYVKDRKLREEMYRMYNRRNCGGEFDNTQILKDIANIRLEIANLMGKKNFSEYQLQHTMAKTPEAVYNLLNQLKDAYKDPMKGELAEIEEFARQTEGADFKLEAWDYPYWSDKLKTARYNFNDEDMKPYFEIDNTIKGVFGLATKLYGYTFKINKDIPVYHPDVLAYEVYDRKGKLMGILYADFYYREGKSPGAWMTEFNSEMIDEEGNKTLPQISIVCNFSKPVGDNPVLLTPYEVETFLHEFGHALHGLSADTKYPGLSGTKVYRDFVETFSQFNENYLTQKEYLDGFARHYKTGKKMPADLLKKFIEAGQYGAAYSCMRQLNFGILDMAYHTIESPLRASCSIETFENEAIDPVRCFAAAEGTMMSPAFGHIFSGSYASGYYGYKWAEVLDADAFAAFQETGIFNQKTAEKFRKMMKSGGTADPMQLYIEFRGQEPTIDALLRRDGIKK